ncbi:MAG: DEAD/DEAH box helicase family protein [Paludibacter sp.]|nr:DEAD/DEAH box helicase family protein [Paludibacter sp.]
MYTLLYGNDIKIFLHDALIEKIPIGKYHTDEFRSKRDSLKEAGIKEMLDFYPVKQVVSDRLNLSIVPRTYQEQVVSKACHPGTLNGIIQSPTRSGKTNMMGMIIARENKSSIIIVHTTLLAKQIEKALKKLFSFDSETSNLILGVVADGRKEFGRPILICTWQSLQNKKTFNQILKYGYNLLFGDEAHRASAEILSNIVGSMKSQKKFGFSASPYRTKASQDEKLHNTFGPIIHKVPIENLYQNNYLVRPTFYRIPTQVHVSVETGIRMYFRQKVEYGMSYRKILANEISRDSAYKTCMSKGRKISDLIYAPSEDDIDLLITVAIANLQKNLSTADDPRSVKIGLAKKGIDFNRQRLAKIEDGVERFFSKIDERGAVVFNLIGAGVYLFNKMKEMGYDNVILLNSKTSNAADMEKIMSGEKRNYIIITTYQYFAEGIDIPSLENIFVASPYYPPFCRIETAEQLSGRCITPDPENYNKTSKIYYFDDIGADEKTKQQKYKVDSILRESFLPNDEVYINHNRYFRESGQNQSDKTQLTQKRN